ncbi:putative copper homeostasis protein CutC [Leptotrichia sp. oral taxon 879 str. F0557]|nr:putative copper homeostasis protein CutC [Leptotrichia sp. oral taxon 879 str. F0557]
MEKMKKYTLEICVDSVKSAINAQRGGATRLELCSNLIIGGTTPTKSLFKEVKKNVDIPINVLIRPRFGDFLYSDYDISIIRNEIKIFREAGVNGIVVGVLTKDGEIDVDNMKKFIDEAQNIPITFHRAFDVCKNPIKAFHQLQELKIQNILTSGQAQNCLKGKKLLKELVDLSNKNNEKTRILVGAGLNIENIEEIADFTGAVNFHFSAKKIKQSKMEYRKQNVNMGLKEFDEFEILETDDKLVRKMTDYLQKRF